MIMAMVIEKKKEQLCETEDTGRFLSHLTLISFLYILCMKKEVIREKLQKGYPLELYLLKSAWMNAVGLLQPSTDALIYMLLAYCLQNTPV